MEFQLQLKMAHVIIQDDCLPAYEVANDICMAHEDFNAAGLLSGWGTMEVLTKCRLNPGSITKKLLKGHK